MVESINASAVEKRMEQLREVVIAEFGFAADTVSTTFHPKVWGNTGFTQEIHLKISPTPSDMDDARWAQVQPFAAAALHKIWPVNRPYACTKMDLPKRADRDPNAEPLPIPT